ncbi:MAG: hypothetical protein H0V91_05125 [Flavisolibacter sp.]|jgi:hypothetical protein|nr:hypothetical protein [Flavisolibacter sp.]
MSSFKEYLEELIDLKRESSITFTSVDGGVSTVRGHIVKFETLVGRDMIETDTGLIIGVDQIIEVNNRQAPDNVA